MCNNIFQCGVMCAQKYVYPALGAFHGLVVILCSARFKPRLSVSVKTEWYVTLGFEPVLTISVRNEVISRESSCHDGWQNMCTEVTTGNTSSGT